MAFRFSPSPFVIVGNAGSAQVIIDPSQPNQIQFINASGVPSGSIGTSGNTAVQMISADGTELVQVLDGAGNGVYIQGGDAGDRVFAFLGSDLNDNQGEATLTFNKAVGLAGFIPIILNSTGFGTGKKWAIQFSYHPGIAVTSNVAFNVALPTSFPLGETGAWAWPSIFSSASGQTVSFSAMFPGGAHNLVQLINTLTQTITFCLISVAEYA